MQTQTTQTPTATPNAHPDDDVIRRGIKRVLPCKLDDDELLQIAKKRVAREALFHQLQADLAKEVKKRKDQLAELEDEIKQMGRELHTEEQDRTVLCMEVFRRGEDGTGYVHTIRMDTWGEVENRPASPIETQRYLPGMDDHVPTGAPNGAEAEAEPAVDEPDDPDDGLDDMPPEDDDDVPEDGDDPWAAETRAIDQKHDQDEPTPAPASNGKSKRKPRKGNGKA